MVIQKRANGGKERRYDPFIAGVVGGYAVFGERNAINEQVRPFPYFPRSIKLIYFGRLFCTLFREWWLRSFLERFHRPLQAL